jgi:hypothetical protein
MFVVDEGFCIVYNSPSYPPNLVSRIGLTMKGWTQGEYEDFNLPRGILSKDHDS